MKPGERTDASGFLLADEGRLRDEREELRRQLGGEARPERREELERLLAEVEDELRLVEREKRGLADEVARPGPVVAEASAGDAARAAVHQQAEHLLELRVQTLLLGVIAWGVTELAGWPLYLRVAVAAVIVLVGRRGLAMLRAYPDALVERLARRRETRGF